MRLTIELFPAPFSPTMTVAPRARLIIERRSKVR
jgi:hypothetical protein